MKREIVKIDRELCNGCGNCIPNCHEGALQMIDGKATLVSELMCDGLGACIGHCPVGAITIEVRDAEPYDEKKVLDEMILQGKNVIIAHLKHLKEHNQHDFLYIGVQYLKSIETRLPFNLHEVISTVHNHKQGDSPDHQTQQECGCPGMKEKNFNTKSEPLLINNLNQNKSELRQWPVQLHLVNPMASYIKGADLVLAADCVAFSLGNFHQQFLRGKSLAIACPKLDSGAEIYIEKLVKMIDEAKINTINVVIMEVPCCGGLLKMAEIARDRASRNVPVKCTVIGLQGDILSEDWI